MPRLLVLLTLLLITTSPARAEMRYVTNQVVVSLRPTPDDRGEPLERLATGMGVELLEENGPLLKVRSAAGNVGFVYGKYFLTTPPQGGAGFQERLAAEERKNAELTAELQRLRAVPAMSGGVAISPELENCRNEVAELTRRVQAAQAGGEQKTITEERDRLQQEVARLTAANKERSPATTGPGMSPLQWFLAGAGVFFAGWLAGKSSRQRRRL